MMQESSIVYPANEKFLIIHDSLRRIFTPVAVMTDAISDVNCAAGILRFFIGWHDYKIKQQSESKMHKRFGLDSRSGDVWVWMNVEEIADGLFRLYGVSKIRQHLEAIVKIGFLERRHNEKVKADRTYQYKVNTGLIQSAINCEKVMYIEVDPSVENNEWSVVFNEWSVENNESRNVENNDCNVENNNSYTNIPFHDSHDSDSTNNKNLSSVPDGTINSDLTVEATILENQIVDATRVENAQVEQYAKNASTETASSTEAKPDDSTAQDNAPVEEKKKAKRKKYAPAWGTDKQVKTDMITALLMMCWCIDHDKRFDAAFNAAVSPYRKAGKELLGMGIDTPQAVKGVYGYVKKKNDTEGWGGFSVNALPKYTLAYLSQQEQDAKKPVTRVQPVSNPAEIRPHVSEEEIQARLERYKQQPENKAS